MFPSSAVVKELIRSVMHIWASIITRDTGIETEQMITIALKVSTDKSNTMQNTRHNGRTFVTAKGEATSATEDDFTI